MTLNSSQDIRGKKVLIMGLGLHGGGLAAALWFHRHGAEVMVTDMKEAVELSESIAKLREAAPHISFRLGSHREEDFLQSDLVIQNPAVPGSSEYLVLCRDNGIRIENELSFFFLMTKGIKKICVTGTRGKSTTTMLIAELLKKSFVSVHCAGVAVGKGTQSFFHILDAVLKGVQEKQDPICVMECSSFQLEALNKTTGGPTYAVITNIYQDHLNRYKTLADYCNAKRNCYQYQDSTGCVILNYDNEYTQQFGMQELPGKRYWFSRLTPKIDGATIDVEPQTNTKWFVMREGVNTRWVCPVETLRLVGEHNIENALAALAIAHNLGISNEDIRETFSSFRGVAYRQEYITAIRERVFVNDTTATSPDGMIAALNVFHKTHSQKIILLAGGSDKNLAFDQCAQKISETVKETLLFEGTATQKMCDALDVHHVSYTRGLQSMDEAVRLAFEKSEEGDMILLSPGAASFGMFKNEYDRGEQFNLCVSNLSL